MSLKTAISKRIHLFKTIRVMMDSRMADLDMKLVKFREDVLRDRAIHCTSRGVSDEKYCDHELIVSLTTYGQRIYDVCLAIESIMQGSLLPNKLILWLGEEFEGKVLPRTLQSQVKRGLEIKYTKDIGSYKKLIPALIQYPGSVIVTIDDDMMYTQEMLEGLLLSYMQNPTAIHANRIHEMTFDENGSLKSYLDWKQEVSYKEVISHPFFTTGGGVLFPPQSLSQETLNEAVFMDICPKADDVWLNAMAILNGTKVIKVNTNNESGEEYVPLSNVREVGLCEDNTNSLSPRNDEQIKAVFNRFGIYEKLCK